MTTRAELKQFVNTHLDRIHRDSEILGKKWKEHFGKAIDQLKDKEIADARKTLTEMAKLADLIEQFNEASSSEEKSRIIAKVKAIREKHKQSKGVLGSYVWKHAVHVLDNIMLARSSAEFEETVKKLLGRG